MPAALRDTRRMNQFVSIAAAVAGLLFGLDIGVIAGALPFITDHFTLSSRLQEWVVSSMMLGAAIGALFNGWLVPPGAQIQPDGRGDSVCCRLHWLRVCRQR
jgi:SP family arabinose:H+ symporter-like MFS transporter